MMVGWIAALVFSDALYKAVSINDGVAFQVASAVAVGVLGLVLWRADDVKTEEVGPYMRKSRRP